MRRAPTRAEEALWSLLRNRRLAGLKFRRQVPLGRYIADFACFEPRLVVEADGGAYQDPDYDAVRDAWLAERGYRVLRFSNSEAIDRPDLVIASVRAAAGLPATDPCPSDPFSREGERTIRGPVSALRRAPGRRT